MATSLRLKFCGLETHIANIVLNQFGMTVDMDPQLAHDALLGQVGLLPEAEWAKCGITDEEIEAHPDYNSHRNEAPDSDFNRKKSLVHQAAVAFRLQYEKDAALGNTFMARMTQDIAKLIERKPKSDNTVAMAPPTQ